MTILRAEKWKATRDDMRIMVILLIFDLEAILSVLVKSSKNMFEVIEVLESFREYFT